MSGTAPGADAPPRTVLVIDDHPLFCEALSMTLRGIFGLDRVLTVNRLGEGLRVLAEGAQPDAIVLDLNLPDAEGIEGLLRLRAVCPGAPVVVVSSYDDNSMIAEVMAAGAVGFIPKNTEREDLAEAFRRIWDGDSYLPPGYAPPNAEGAKGDPGNVGALLAQLTPQQMRILELVSEGKLNKQIAWELSIAETTVKAHITAILKKLRVQNRMQAVLIAQQARFQSILHR